MSSNASLAEIIVKWHGTFLNTASFVKNLANQMFNEYKYDAILSVVKLSKFGKVILSLADSVLTEDPIILQLLSKNDKLYEKDITQIPSTDKDFKELILMVMKGVTEGSVSDKNEKMGYIKDKVSKMFSVAISDL